MIEENSKVVIIKLLFSQIPEINVADLVFKCVVNDYK